jgi:hypothetical protein
MKTSFGDIIHFVRDYHRARENSKNLPDSPEAQELAKLQTRMQRPGLEVNREGSFELGWGIAMLCAGLDPYFSAVVIKSTWFTPWTTWVAYLPLFCAPFALLGVPKLIKRFITWPRTGYVANPNEIKLSRLLILMVFGLALGGAIGQLYTLVFRTVVMRGLPAVQNALPSVTLTCIKLLIYTALAVYLGPKVIQKRRPPLPAAYDAAVINQGLNQTAFGRKIVRGVKLTLLAMCIGLPLFVFAIVFGLLYGTKLLLHHPEFHWSQLGMPVFLVACNALLYLMASGVVLKPNRWKWFLVPLMLLVPILVAPAIPYPAANPGSSPMLDQLPPVMLCIGSVWFLSGAIALLLFMHHNRLPAEAS